MDRPLPVFRGQTFEAVDLQSKLEEAGIPVALVYLPHAAGSELNVPRERVDEALRIIQSESGSKAHQSDPTDESDPEIDALRGLTKRIGPLAMSVVGAPAGFMIGILYLVRVRGLGRRPVEHGHILVAWFASVVMSWVALVLLVALLRF